MSINKTSYQVDKLPSWQVNEPNEFKAINLQKPEEVLVSLKKKAAMLETLQKDGVVKKRDIKDVQKELAVTIKELEVLLNV